MTLETYQTPQIGNGTSNVNIDNYILDPRP